MNRLDIVAMFFFAQFLAGWGLWHSEPGFAPGAVVLTFITLECIAIVGWLIMQFFIKPVVVKAVEWAADKINGPSNG